MSYLDTADYYLTRQRQVEYAILRRGYMEGFPYSIDPDTKFDLGELWKALMSPTDEEGDFPSFLENFPMMLVRGFVDDIFPPDSKLVVDGLSEKQTKDLFEKMFDFGSGYARGVDGLIQWYSEVLMDVGTVGDGLIHIRLLEKGIRWHHYPMESWDAEAMPDSDDPEFYRVEYKYKRFIENPAKDEPDVRTFWRRIDFHKHEIVRYDDTPVPWELDDGQVPPNRMSTADVFAAFVPPDMEVDNSQDILESASEMIILRELDEFVCQQVVWRRAEPGSMRGIPEISIDRMVSTDDINRLLTSHKSAAINAGDPILAAIDLDVPEEPGEEGDELSPADVKGDILNMTSESPERAGKFGYPENQPVKFLHGEAKEEVRRAALQSSQNLGVDVKDILARGEVSGFAMSQMTTYHDKRIDRLRTRLFENALFLMFKRAQRILKLTGRIDEGQAKANIRIEYGARSLSPDELLKMTTILVMLMDKNIPEDELIRLLPFKPHDREAVIKALAEKRKEMQENAEMLTTLRTGSIEDGAGIDKKLRTAKS